MLSASELRPAALRSSLVAPAQGPFTLPEWIRDSYDDPPGFWKAMAPVLLASAAGASRSSPFDRYCLFHELAGRHAPTSAAFVAEDGVETSFGDLCAHALALSMCWRELGVEPESSVAVVGRFSLDMVTACLAAWHCGAVVTPLPSTTDGFVQRRFVATAPDFLVASASKASMLKVPDSLVLPAVAPRKFFGRSPPNAHQYAPKAPAARFFSPVSPKGATEAFVVSAERLLLGALRDGVLLLALSAGNRVAAPEFCEMQWRPPLLLAALATGSAFCDIDLADCVRSPKRLRGIDVLAVGAELRDAITSASTRLPRGLLRRWIRDAAADPAHDAWAHFAACEALEGALGMNAYANAAAGGMIVFSPWRQDPSANTVIRAPGGGFQIADVNLSGMHAISDSGVLTGSDDAVGPDTIGQPVLAKTGDEYVLVTVLGAHRDGQTLPMAEMSDVASSLGADVWQCACVSFSQSARATSQRCALVVFARPTYEGDDLGQRVDDAIARELGDGYRPHHVAVFRVAPRKGKGGTIDADWCRTQYLTGALTRKDGEAVFRALARLLYALEQGEL